MSSENNEQKSDSSVVYEPVLPSPLDSLDEQPTPNAEPAAQQPTPNAEPAAQQPTPNANFRRPPLGRPTPPFPLPPRPLGFWGLLVKDATVVVVGVATFCFLSLFLFFALLTVFANALNEASESALVVEETLSGNDDSLGKIVVLPIEGA